MDPYLCRIGTSLDFSGLFLDFVTLFFRLLHPFFHPFYRKKIGRRLELGNLLVGMASDFFGTKIEIPKPQDGIPMISLHWARAPKPLGVGNLDGN